MTSERAITTSLGEIVIREHPSHIDKPPVLCIPDCGDLIGAQSIIWRCPLTSYYSLAAVDPLGSGGSAQPSNAAYSVQEHADVIHQALTTIPSRARWSLVGFGTGFCLAVELSRRYPKTISHVVGLGVGGMDSRPISGKYPISKTVEQFISSELPMWIKREQTFSPDQSPPIERISGEALFFTLRNIHEYIRTGELYQGIKECRIPLSWIVSENANVRSMFLHSSVPGSLSLVEVPSRADDPLVGNYQHTIISLQVALGVGREL